MKSIKILFNKLNAWRKAKVEENKQPLSRENAYVLTTLGKKGNYNDVSFDFLKAVLSRIKEVSKMGHSHLLQEFPPLLSLRAKEYTIDKLKELQYSICYSDDKVMLITWLYPPEDFNKVNHESGSIK